MKHGFLRVAAVSPDLKVADVEYNAEQIAEHVLSLAEKGVELAVFPELSLCGYTCGDLFLQSALTEACERALVSLAQKTKQTGVLFYVGLPVALNNRLYDCAAAVCRGKILGIIPKTHLPAYAEFYETRWFAPAPSEGEFVLLNGEYVPFGSALIVRDEKHRDIAIGCEICEDVWVSGPPSDRACAGGATVVVNLSASTETVGKREYRKTILSAQSGRNLCGYVYADAGVGESVSDAVFAGNHLIYENGSLLCEAEPFSGDTAIAEIDVGFLLAERRRMTTFPSATWEGYDVVCDFMTEGDLSFRRVPPLPFVPAEGVLDRAESILKIQTNALARRLEHAHAKTAVVGISGGLDSSLALLVCARAFDLLGWDRKGVLAVTMPGFGTTSGTKSNALSLIRAMGATQKTVPIAKTVRSHFADIGHDEMVHDTAYENAQARYRTMILMDLANATGGLVIGTGDLSELALGWCTYNGDHMSMYAVNCSIPKTLVKYLVKSEAERLGGACKKVLERILATEISPELLPPENGEIAQKTEDIIGPYELHDFFLYRTVRCGDVPEKATYLAKYAFAGKYSDEEITKWQNAFYKRFFSQQFKRNCVPDGVKVGSVSLSPRADWRMPSDASDKLFLK